jgi:hypothetical protein
MKHRIPKFLLGLATIVASPVLLVGWFLMNLFRIITFVGEGVLEDHRRRMRRRAASRPRPKVPPKEDYPKEATWDDMTRRIGDIPDDARATDYCKRCGESPESGTHLFDHPYQDPRK